jgi:hypothetical protein
MSGDTHLTRPFQIADVDVLIRQLYYLGFPLSSEYKTYKAGLSLFSLGFSRWCDALHLILLGFFGVLSAFSTHYSLRLEMVFDLATTSGINLPLRLLLLSYTIYLGISRPIVPN